MEAPELDGAPEAQSKLNDPRWTGRSEALDTALAALAERPEPSSKPLLHATGANRIRQAVRAVAVQNRELKGKKPNSRKTPSVEKLYGPLVRAGLAKIVRKKGRPPMIEFLGTPSIA